MREVEGDAVKCQLVIAQPAPLPHGLYTPVSICRESIQLQHKHGIKKRQPRQDCITGEPVPRQVVCMPTPACLWTHGHMLHRKFVCWHLLGAGTLRPFRKALASTLYFTRAPASRSSATIPLTGSSPSCRKREQVNTVYVHFHRGCACAGIFVERNANAPSSLSST